MIDLVAKLIIGLTNRKNNRRILKIIVRACHKRIKLALISLNFPRYLYKLLRLNLFIFQIFIKLFLSLDFSLQSVKLCISHSQQIKSIYGFVRFFIFQGDKVSFVFTFLLLKILKLLGVLLESRKTAHKKRLKFKKRKSHFLGNIFIS
jgi:hypothetical protein